MKDYKLISGSNYFKQDNLKAMIGTLDSGEKIEVYIDCIGHTRNNMTQEQYKKALEEHYGDKLNVIYNGGYCSYSYRYELEV